LISKIRGKVEYIRDNYAVIETGGIGYKIFLTDISLGRVVKKDEADFFIHTHVKEDQLALFGFETLEELEIFELLLSISGIGPKAGLGILTIATPATIKSAIVNEDSSILTKVSGIGKKTAERVILELKNKVDALPEKQQKEAQSGQDVIEALISMGYSATEARQAIRSIPKDIKDESQQIKLALKAMKK